MAMTLVEAAKAETGDVLRAGIIEQFPRSSDLLMALPFEDIPGNAMRYNVEETLPGVAFRGINESYTEDVGVINPVTEPLHILGGDLDIDNFIIKTQGAGQQSARVSMKVKALAHKFTESFFKGDTGADPREFDGLQNRLTGSQVIDNGSGSGGTALSLAKLDEAIDAVDNPTAIFMSKAMRRRLTTAARTASVAATINYEQDAFGRRLAFYNDLPIMIVDQDNEGNNILGFTEAAASGGATATSIYVVSFGTTSVSGIQNGGIDVRNLGEIDSAPVRRVRVEWYPGVAVFNPRGAARLRYISDAAVTA